MRPCTHKHTNAYALTYIHTDSWTHTVTHNESHTHIHTCTDSCTCSYTHGMASYGVSLGPLLPGSLCLQGSQVPSWPCSCTPTPDSSSPPHLCSNQALSGKLLNNWSVSGLHGSVQGAPLKWKTLHFLL